MAARPRDSWPDSRNPCQARQELSNAGYEEEQGWRSGRGTAGPIAGTRARPGYAGSATQANPSSPELQELLLGMRRSRGGGQGGGQLAR